MGSCGFGDSKVKFMKVGVVKKDVKILSQSQAEEAFNSYDQNYSLIKFLASDYQQICKKYEKISQSFEDLQFPASQSSIGKAQLSIQPEWKRVPEIFKDSVFVERGFGSQDVMQGQLGDCYVLSAISSLAEYNLIDRIFPYKSNNPQGVYAVRLLIQGKLNQVIVSDRVPVNKKGRPLFAQPAGKEFWPLILEKAWAKSFGSYGAIISGLPGQVLRAASYAPSYMYILNSQSSQTEKEMIWNKIHQAQRQRFSICCSTKGEVDFRQGLIANHAYSLLDSYQNLDCCYGHSKIVKIRNPWGKGEWSGRCSDKDQQFLKSLSKESRKLMGVQSKNDGIFKMLYDDYLKYFQMMEICHANQRFSFNFLEFPFAAKRASFFEIIIPRNNTSTYITLSQPYNRTQTDSSKLARATIILSKRNEKGQLVFVNGKTSSQYPDETLGMSLDKGIYYVYAKFEWLDQSIKNGVINIYSQHPVAVKNIAKKSFLKEGQNFLQQILFHHAQTVEEGKGKSVLDTKNDWFVSKFLYKQCGLGYIALNISPNFKKKINVKFEQKNFEAAGFRLKKPYKYKGTTECVLDSMNSRMIIIARVKRDNQLTRMNFPPEISIVEGN